MKVSKALKHKVVCGRGGTVSHRQGFLLWVLAFLVAAGPTVLLAQAGEDTSAGEAKTTQPVVEPLPRATAHATLNDFMEMYRKGDAESKKQMVAYLDLSLLSEEDRSDTATLTLRLAEFLDNNKIASNAKFEELKSKLDDVEHCLLLESEPVEPKTSQPTDELQSRRCLVRLVQQGDGLWQFDAETVASIKVLAAKKEPEPAKVVPAEVQPAAAKQAAAPDEPRRKAVNPAYASPQATMRTFLQAFADKDAVSAAACLNLKSYGVQPNDRMAVLLARAVKFVLDRTVYVEFLALPEDADHKSPYVYRVIQDRWNFAFERVDGGPWLISTATLDQLQDMCRAVASSPPKVPHAPVLSLREMPELWLFLKLPPQMQRTVGGLELWQWLGLLLVIMAGVFCDRVARRLLRRVSRWIIHRIRGRADARLEESALRPIGLLILGYVWLEFFQWLWLPKMLANVLTNAASFIFVVAGIWATYRLIDLIFGYLSILADRTTSKFDVMLVPFGRKILKVAVTIIGLVYFANRLAPEHLTTLLGGLGLGGLAFALAAQDTLKNLFGSITLMLDRPFEIGDWVKIGDVEGTVESVGFRSTRIRTFYQSQVNVPNGKLIDAIVDNLGRRRYRRIRCMLSLTYDTSPEKIEAFCEGIRELIRRHPFTRKDYYHVYLNQLAAHSLDVLLYCFIAAPDWGTELRERHRLFADILRLAKQLGVEFAFPTQTLHMHRHNADAVQADDSGRMTEGDDLPPEVVGRSEAAAITQSNLPPADALGPVEIAAQPQPVDDAYVRRRMGRAGKGTQGRPG